MNPLQREAQAPPARCRPGGGVPATACTSRLSLPGHSVTVLNTGRSRSLRERERERESYNPQLLKLVALSINHAID